MGQIVVNNRVFKDCKSISVTSFYVYFCIRAYQVEDINKDFTVPDIITDVGLVKSTLMRTMRDLTKLKYLKSKKKYNTLKVPTKKYTLQLHSCEVHGCSVFNVDLIKRLILLVNDNEINKRHFQILIYLLHKKHTSKSDTITMTQSDLSRALGVTKNAINISLKELNRDAINNMPEEHRDNFSKITLLEK